MKLVVITHDWPHGRGESFLGPELAALGRLGHDILVLPARARSIEVRHDIPDRVEVVTIRFGAMRSARLAAAVAIRQPRTVLRLLRLLTRDPRRLVHNLAVLPQGLALSFLMQDADHVHGHWLSTVGTVTMVAGTAAGVGWSLTGHRWDIASPNLIGTKVAQARFVRVISRSGAAMLQQHVPGAKPHVVHLGVHVPTRGLDADLYRQVKRLRVACPANLIPVKGHDVLLHAVCLLRRRGVDVALDVIGCGPLDESLRLLCAHLALDDVVTFRGQVRHADLLREYVLGRYDVVCLASRDLGGGEHEGIPVTLMEAMAHAIPVIATRTGGIPELVDDGVSGLLVADGDEEALAGALARLADPKERRRLGVAGRGRVMAHFDVEKCASTLVRLMERR